jgi:exodeoxyribonuclease VII small subunit
MAREKHKDPKPPEPGGSEPDDVRYGAAVLEIERILESIDRDQIDLDELGQKVERAVELLKICRAKLKTTEARVAQVLEDLAKEEAAEADASDEESTDEEPAEEDAPEESGEGEKGASSAPRRERRKKDADEDDLPF